MRRTRRIILVLILLVVAGVTFSWRLQKETQARETPPAPATLPDTVSARASDWTWEETRNNRPVVRVRARDFKQSNTTGKIELEDVELHVFHSDAATYDRVKSAKADFDTSQALLFSEGEVEITMGVPVDPKTKPASRLINIRTSGARFETRTGKASTERPAFFQFDNGEGQCTGAIYDPGTGELTMQKDVRLLWRGGASGSKPMEVEAGSLIYKEAESTIWLLPWSKFRRDTLAMEGGAAIVKLREGVIETIDAKSAWGVDTRPRQQTHYQADDLNIRFNEKGVLQTITGDKNARLTSATPTARTTVDAARIDMDFDAQEADSVLKKALATGGAVVESNPIPRPGAPLADTRVMKSQIIALYMRPGGEEIDHVDTEARGVIEFRPNRPGQKRRIVDGDNIRIQYAANNEVKSFQAVDVSTRTETPPGKGKPQPPALTWSQGMNAEFEPRTGALTLLEQWGAFRYEEGERRATAERAEMRGPSEDVLLTGAARVWDSTGSTAADWILMRQKAGEVEAAGNVTSTRLAEKKQQPAAPGLLSSDEPLQAKAARMTTTDNNMVVVYEGDALLWQGTNRVRGDRIRIDRRTGRLDAWGKVESQLLEKADAKKKKERVYTVVRAPELNYDDKQRLAHYKGGTTLHRGAMVVTAREIRAFLAPGEGDASLDRAYADGNVKIVETTPARTRTGVSEHAEYYTGTGKVVLAGGRPRFADSVDGVTEGRQITFYSNDGRLVVEGEQAAPVESKIRRKSG